MGDRLPLVSTPGGITHTWQDNGDGTYTIHSEQDCSAALDLNKAMANHNDGYTPSRDMRRAAHIPDIVLLLWRQELGGGHGPASDPLHPSNRKWLLRRLDDPDWRFLRTAPGRLGTRER